VEAEVAAAHEVDYDISVRDMSVTLWASIAASSGSRGGFDSQILHILETIPQITQKRVIQVLQHAPFADYIPHTFGTHNLIFANVLQSERETAVFPLNDAHFAKSAFADHTKEPEVVEVHLVGEEDGFAIGVAHGVDVAWKGYDNSTLSIRVYRSISCTHIH